MTEDIERRKICKGCIFYGQEVTFSDGRKGYIPICRIKYPVLTSTIQCPCLTCLVKSMCSHTCEDFFKYRDRVLEVEYGPK